MSAKISFSLLNPDTKFKVGLKRKQKRARKNSDYYGTSPNEQGFRNLARNCSPGAY